MRPAGREDLQRRQVPGGPRKRAGRQCVKDGHEPPSGFFRYPAHHVPKRADDDYTPTLGDYLVDGDEEQQTLARGHRAWPDPTSDCSSVSVLKCRDLAGYFRRSSFRHTLLFMVSEEQIQQWADEAEAGYDVEAMKRRGRGRPGRGSEPMQVVAVRLTVEELAAVDAIAEREHISRSEAIRRALAGFAA